MFSGEDEALRQSLTPSQLEIAELGKPRLGEYNKCQITIKESKEFQVLRKIRCSKKRLQKEPLTKIHFRVSSTEWSRTPTRRSCLELPHGENSSPKLWLSVEVSSKENIHRKSKYPQVMTTTMMMRKVVVVTRSRMSLAASTTSCTCWPSRGSSSSPPFHPLVSIFDR